MVVMVNEGKSLLHGGKAAYDVQRSGLQQFQAQGLFQAAVGGGVGEFLEDHLHHLPHLDAATDAAGDRGTGPAAGHVHV